jgi:hypothetical protein
MLGGIRGALACFAAAPIIWLALFCTIWNSDVDFWGRKWDTLEWIYSLIFATGFGSILVWMVGFPAVAIGLTLGRNLKRRVS